MAGTQPATQTHRFVSKLKLKKCYYYSAPKVAVSPDINANYLIFVFSMYRNANDANIANKDASFTFAFFASFA